MPTQNGLASKGWSLKPRIVIDQEQSYFEVTLAFDRERKEGQSYLSFKNDRQRMSLRWYADAFEGPYSIEFEKAETRDDLPPQLKKMANINKVIKRGLYKITLSFKPEMVVLDGAFNALDFSSDEKSQVYKTFLNLVASEQAEFFIPLSNDTVKGALDALKGKMLLEYQRAAFSEYQSHNGNHM